LKQIQLENALSQDVLEGHDIKFEYRAKMVDWIVEVLSAFGCSDQTFFLTISMMDRYFDSLRQQGRHLQLSELHQTGVTCMFIASKYEDVIPLLMRTVFNKIGHCKISEKDILAREKDILISLGFKIGGLPTPLEFLDIYVEKILSSHPDKNFIHKMAVYLTKMAVHHQALYSQSAVMIGSSSIYVALKICEQMRQTTILTKELCSALCQVSDIKERDLIESSKKLLYLAQNFETELPGMSNLKKVYIPELNKFVQ